MPKDHIDAMLEMQRRMLDDMQRKSGVNDACFGKNYAHACECTCQRCKDEKMIIDEKTTLIFSQNNSDSKWVSRNIGGLTGDDGLDAMSFALYAMVRKEREESKYSVQKIKSNLSVPQKIQAIMFSNSMKNATTIRVLTD